jgi:carbon storage regulator
MKGVIMLVLSRKEGEKVCVGNSVTVTVVSVRNGRVRLGFDAPASVEVDRKEVRQRRNVSEFEDEEDAVPVS